MILDLFMQTGFKSFFSGILILMLAMAVMIIYMAFKNQKLNRELQELKSKGLGRKSATDLILESADADEYGNSEEESESETMVLTADQNLEGTSDDTASENSSSRENSASETMDGFENLDEKSSVEEVTEEEILQGQEAKEPENIEETESEKVETETETSKPDEETPETYQEEMQNQGQAYEEEAKQVNEPGSTVKISRNKGYAVNEDTGEIILEHAEDNNVGKNIPHLEEEESDYVQDALKSRPFGIDSAFEVVSPDDEKALALSEEEEEEKLSEEEKQRLAEEAAAANRLEEEKARLEKQKAKIEAEAKALAEHQKEVEEKEKAEIRDGFMQLASKGQDEASTEDHGPSVILPTMDDD